MVDPAPDDTALALAERPGGLTAVPPEQFLAALERLASNKDVDPAKLSAFLDLQDRINATVRQDAANRAFHAMTPHLPRVRKSKAVQYPKNKNQPEGPKYTAFKYAPYEDLDEALRPILTEYGFSLSYDTRPREGGGAIVVAFLTHVMGHVRQAEFPVPLDTSGGKSNLQGMGSSTTFGQRYAAKLVLNLVFEDDDDDGQKGGLSFLGDDQLAELRGLMRETRTDERQFLEVQGYPPDAVHRLEEVEAKDFVKCRNALVWKQRRQAELKAPHEPA